MVHLGSGLGPKYSLEGTPIVKDGVMYFATGNDDVYALDAKTGALIWEHRSGIDQNINTVCCGWDNRGVAVGEGKVFVGQLDGTFVALDAKTGKPLWQTQIGALAGRLHDHGRAAVLQRRRLYRHFRRRPLGARQARGARRQDRQGAVALLDRARPRRRSAPTPGPAPNDPDPKRAQGLSARRRHIWQTPAIDPELGLIYFSTGNPGLTAVGIGRDRPGDNLFASSIVALQLDGTYAWHFQQVHHDIWDFDCPSPVVLFDQIYDGKLRKGIAEACKTGWIYILDRTNGKPLIGIEEKPVEQEPRSAHCADAADSASATP